MKAKSSGFSIIEIVLAFALATIILSGIFEASWLAEKNILYFFGLDNAIKKAGQDGVVVERYVTPCMKSLEGSVYWKGDLDMATHTLSTYFLNRDSQPLSKSGGDCGGYFSSDFSTTSVSNSNLINSPIEFTVNDIYKNYNFVAAASSDPQSPDLIVYSLLSLEQVSAFNFGLGSNSIDVANGYAFVAQRAPDHQFVVVDVHNPNQPILVASSSLPGVAGAKPEGWSIYYYDSKIYIGTKRTAGNEFHIFDVSNPTTPVWLGSKELNHNINAIVVKNGLAYLATSGNTKDIIILDINSPSHITEGASLDLPGNEDGKSIYLLGNKIFLGRFKSTVSSHHEFFEIDAGVATTSWNMTILGSFDTKADINSVKVFWPYAFLGTSSTTAEFIILKFLESPLGENSSTTISKISSYDLPSKSINLDYENSAVSVLTIENSLALFNFSPQ